MKDPKKKNASNWMLWALLIMPIAWFAAVLENCLQANFTLDSLMQSFTYFLSNPFSIAWTTRTAAFILAAVLCYALAVAVYESERQNTRTGEVIRNDKGKAILMNSYSLLQDRYFEKPTAT